MENELIELLKLNKQDVYPQYLTNASVIKNNSKGLPVCYSEKHAGDFSVAEGVIKPISKVIQYEE